MCTGNISIAASTQNIMKINIRIAKKKTIVNL